MARSRPPRARRRIPSDSEQFPSLLARSRSSNSVGVHKNMPVSIASYTFDFLADIHDTIAVAADFGGIVNIEDACNVGIDAENDFSMRKMLLDHHTGCLRLEEMVCHQ